MDREDGVLPGPGPGISPCRGSEAPQVPRPPPSPPSRLQLKYPAHKRQISMVLKIMTVYYDYEYLEKNSSTSIGRPKGWHCPTDRDGKGGNTYFLPIYYGF